MLRPAIEDQPDELRAMLRDMSQAPDVFRPTHFWNYFQRESYRYIEKRGITEFRASVNMVWAPFGAVIDPLLGHFPPRRRAVRTGARASPQAVPHSLRSAARQVPGLSRLWRSWRRPGLLDRFREAYESQLRLQLALYYQYCYATDERRRITAVSDSGLGAPNIVLTVEGKPYTIPFLRAFLQLCYLEGFVDFSSVARVIEIGGGYGAFAEVLLQSYPHLRYVDVDIPPQSYIAQQYLAACFPGRVCGYRAAQAYIEKTGEAAPADAPESIFVLCPWQLPFVQGRYDLFVNSASFQEMEPAVVASYAAHLTRLVDRFGYIRATPHGMNRADAAGEKGVIDPVTQRHYQEYFGAFELIADTAVTHGVPRAAAGTFDPATANRDMFFRRTTGESARRG